MSQNLRALPEQELLKRWQVSSETPILSPEMQRAADWAAEQFNRFTQMCPDWKGTPAEAEALVRHLPAGEMFSAEQLRDAHVTAWYRGEYPAEPEKDINLYTMPLDELRDAAFGIAREEPDPLLKMSPDALKTEWLRQQFGDIDLVLTTPTNELKAMWEQQESDKGESA